MAFWLVMSGFFDVIHILMGAASIAVVMAVNHRLWKYNYYEDEVNIIEKVRLGSFLLYVPWLAYQIVVSGLQVARIILSPSLPISTKVLRFKVDLPSAHAKMILGNSITLTPGTLTVDIEGDEFLVHALAPQSIGGITSDAMPRQVLRLFTSDTHQVVSDLEIIRDKEEL